MKAIRFHENPIIFSGLSPEIGENINGPSLIQVPAWVRNPLAKYYLYFAHHQGQFIRMAFADDLHGPWKCREGGVLGLGDTMFEHHIASPDVHLDEESRQIVMYFHGVMPRGSTDFAGQRTAVAVSEDGLVFRQFGSASIGPFYFRVFRYKGAVYAVAKTTLQDGGGELLSSRDGFSPFTKIKDIIPFMRHAAVILNDDRFVIFYSRCEDRPERILCSEIMLNGDPANWMVSEPIDVLSPHEIYEGGELPLEKSQFGAVHEAVRQLRDPAVYRENGRIYLVYSCAGEQGIAACEIKDLFS
ncbi:MAG: hypothetical protein HN368_15965 [Spirochaetales bacterium]|nr:hypothetical protein [Spirochaetales bacterium]